MQGSTNSDWLQDEEKKKRGNQTRPLNAKLCAYRNIVLFETVANNIYIPKKRKSDSKLEKMSKEFLLKNYEEDDGNGDGDDDQDEKDDDGGDECYQNNERGQETA